MIFMTNWTERRKAIEQDYRERLNRIREQKNQSKTQWDTIQQQKENELKTKLDTTIKPKEETLQKEWEELNKARQLLLAEPLKEKITKIQKRGALDTEIIQRRSKGQNSRFAKAYAYDLNKKIKRGNIKINKELETIIQSPEYKEWQTTQWDTGFKPRAETIQKEAQDIITKYNQEIQNLFNQSDYKRYSEDYKQTQVDRQNELAELEYQRKLEEAEKTGKTTTITFIDSKGKVQGTIEVPDTPYMIELARKNYYRNKKDYATGFNQNIGVIKNPETEKLMLADLNQLNKKIENIYFGDLQKENKGTYYPNKNEFVYDTGKTINLTENDKLYERPTEITIPYWKGPPYPDNRKIDLSEINPLDLTIDEEEEITPNENTTLQDLERITNELETKQTNANKKYDPYYNYDESAYKFDYDTYDDFIKTHDEIEPLYKEYTERYKGYYGENPQIYANNEGETAINLGNLYGKLAKGIKLSPAEKDYLKFYDEQGMGATTPEPLPPKTIIDQAGDYLNEKSEALNKFLKDNKEQNTIIGQGLKGLDDFAYKASYEGQKEAEANRNKEAVMSFYDTGKKGYYLQYNINGSALNTKSTTRARNRQTKPNKRTI